MQAGTKCIKILDLGSGIQWYYDPRSRCAIDPQYFHAHSELMTNQAAFIDVKMLADITAEDIVFVETHDSFSVWNAEKGTYIPSLRVWRKSQVLGPTIYPGRREIE